MENGKTRQRHLGNACLSITLAGAALLACTPAMAETLAEPPDFAIKTRSTSCENAQVLRVIDGDTLVVSGSQGTEKVRISQISAPKKSQRSGPSALMCLHNLVASKPVSICRDGRDRYGLTLADLTVDGKDVATSLVGQGCAFTYRHYLEANSPLPELQGRYWFGKDPLPAPPEDLGAPWLYRTSSAPVPLLANGQTPVKVSSVTTATTINRLLDWAEFKFDELLQGGSSTRQVGTNGDGYRCYSSGACLGLIDHSVVFYDGQQIRPLISEAEALRAAQADGY